MKTNIVIVGGSGFWSDQNHIKNILNISAEIDVRVVAIIDPVNPMSVNRHENLQRLMHTHKPQWVNPNSFNSVKDIFEHLKNRPDFVIIASNPETHFIYGRYCLKYNIPSLIDKPALTAINASSDISSALSINNQYKELLNEYRVHKTAMFSILRRRSLPAFVRIAKELHDAHELYKTPITHITLEVNGGIHKLPIEFEKNKGAHAYQQGVGSLAHSSYHYIDVVTWLLKSAPGEITHMNIRLNYVKRVSDYIQTMGYSYIQDVLGLNDSEISNENELSQRILAAELDVSYTLELLDAKKKLVGSIIFTFNHTGFSPREHGLEFDSDHANHPNGGRMSQFYLDVHQSAIQNWKLIKDDVVFNGHRISLTGRKHPKFGCILEQINYDNAYDDVESSMEDMTQSIIASMNNGITLAPTSNIRTIEDEEFNMCIFGAFYELLANDYQSKCSSKLIDISGYL